RNAALHAQLDKMRALQRTLGKQDAVIGEDANGIAADPREAAHQGRAIELLELVELAAVDDAGDDVAHVVGPAHVIRDDAVDLLGRVERLLRLGERQRYRLHRIEIAGNAARDAERVAVIERVMIGDAGDAAVDVGAAKLLGGDDLAGGRLHQWRAAKKDRALAFDDDALVRHRRHISAARGARSHDDRDLWHAERREL